MRITRGLAVIAALAIIPAQAQDRAATTAAPSPAKKICRMITPTGTMFPKRFCLTASEWREFTSLNASSADKALSGRMHGRLSVGDSEQ